MNTIVHLSALLLIVISGLNTSFVKAQSVKWQQRVSCQIDIEFDHKKHQFSGTEKLQYHNNSPDTLNRVFFHLYFNAFQPGSMMDVRSRTIADPDPRVLDRISKLKPNEIGYLRITSLLQNGKNTNYEEVGTILEVQLTEPILPNSMATFDLTFEAQVPVQIRRSGRNNIEGIDYSMAQWYPKIAEYDGHGWHSNPYVGREFHGVWGDFEVRITIDASYVVAATGHLQNPNQVGHGYETQALTNQTNKGTLTWIWKAENVHDFVWAADPDYEHEILRMDNGPELHFFYVKDSITETTWAELPRIVSNAFDFMNRNFGRYPYKKYSFIQGGDGAMEYPMATLILGQTSFSSLTGSAIHELIHSWFQGVLANNESLHPWMDEGFTTFASAETKSYLFGNSPGTNPHASSYDAYLTIARHHLEEPLSTHSDFYQFNGVYSVAAYNKGAILLNQLGYIIGKETLMRGMRRYFNEWKFKHPDPVDFKKIMEKESGLQLDWYFEQFIFSTNTIDYKINSVEKKGNNTLIELNRIGKMPMPLDVVVTYRDGKMEIHNIPLRIMRGNKKPESNDMTFIVRDDWPWTHPAYQLLIPASLDQILKIEIDPSERMADVNRKDNVFISEDSKLKIKQN